MLRAGPLLGLLCPRQATPEGSVNPTRHSATWVFMGTFSLLSYVIFTLIPQDGGPAFPFWRCVKTQRSRSKVICLICGQA